MASAGEGTCPERLHAACRPTLRAGILLTHSRGLHILCQRQDLQTSQSGTFQAFEGMSAHGMVVNALIRHGILNLPAEKGTRLMGTSGPRLQSFPGGRSRWRMGFAPIFAFVAGVFIICLTAQGQATQLAFVQPPSNTLVGSTIAPPVTVAVEDVNGNVIATDNSERDRDHRPGQWVGNSQRHADRCCGERHSAVQQPFNFRSRDLHAAGD